MRNLSRIVWSEGMALGPHHFQAQARYFEDSIQFATSALCFEPYGLIGCGLDAEALRNGTVSVLHARGIFPDGLAFYMPESDPLPRPRNIRELFPPVQDSLGLFLGVGSRRPDGVNCALADTEVSETTRYVAESHSVPDQNTGQDEKPVGFARKNIRLFLESELNPNIVSLQIARIQRDGSGHFIYDPKFVAPSLQISASARLMELTERLLGILEEKSRMLAGHAQPGPGMRAGLSPREVSSFWFLHAVNSSIVPLRHLFQSTRAHPEELYSILVGLGGALCTFAIDSDPRSIPTYEHARLGECFDLLDKHIRRHLELVIPTNCVSIPLEPVENYLYAGRVLDSRCLGRSQWILSIRAAVGEADLISRSPQLIKVCSKDFVPKLVQRAMPGLELTHVPVPPPAVSPKVESQYFSIGRIGPCWDHIVQTKEIGVYIPEELVNPEVEVLVILDSQNIS